MKRLRFVLTSAPRANPKFKLAPDELVSFAPMDALVDGLGGLAELETRAFSEVAAGSYNYFEDGDVLLAKVTPCFENGKKAIAKNLENGAGFATSEVLVFRPYNDGIEARYLRYLFCSEDFRHKAIASMTGAGGLRRVSERAVLDFPLRITNLATQRQIADFLDRETARINLLIEKKQRLVALLGEKKEAELLRLEKRLFSDESKVSRLSYHVTKVGSGKTPSGGATVYQDSGVLFLRSQNIRNDGVSLTDAAYISEEIDAEMTNSRVQPCDVLLNITGASLGRCAIAPNDLPPANVNQHVCIIRPMKHLLPEYLHILFLTPRMQGVIRAEAFSAGREGLNFESIRNMRIPVPGLLETQCEIADQIKSISRRDQNILDANERSIDRLEEYRSALITSAVTGQIDVQTYAKSGTHERRLDAIQEEMQA